MTYHRIFSQSGKYQTLDNLKQLAVVPFFIPWYRSSESNKVFPLILNEISDLNASKELIPRLLGNNPFFEHTNITYTVAFDNGKPAGRVAAFVDDRYNSEHSQEEGWKKTGWIGLFECVEDTDLAKKLLSTAVRELKEQGCEKVIGPAKYNANGEVGILVEGFQHKPYFMETYNPPYYQAFFEDFGFAKENDWYSVQVYDIKSPKLQDYMSRVERLKRRALESKDERGQLIREINIRNAKFSRIKDEIRIIKSVYNSEWGKGNHPQFVTMSPPEFDSLAAGIKAIALEDLVLIAELKGEPIGVAVTVPNVNAVIDAYDQARPDYLPSQKFISPNDLYRDISILGNIKKKLRDKSFETARVLILGVKEEYRTKGIDALLYYESFRNAESIGIKAASFSELADINLDIVAPLTKMGDIAMTWRVYSLDI